MHSFLRSSLSARLGRPAWTLSRRQFISRAKSTDASPAEAAQSPVPEPPKGPQSRQTPKTPQTEWLKTPEIDPGRKHVRMRSGPLTVPSANWLRDCCRCSQCVDSSTTQKLFQTSDIPEDLMISTAELLDNGYVKITWENDIKGYGPEHASVFPRDLFSFKTLDKVADMDASLGVESADPSQRVLWDKQTMAENCKFISCDEYMSSDASLFEALQQLKLYGLLFIRGVPATEEAVESIGQRIGTLRDTFYGRTWNVKSVANAKNVAYTNQNLGFHMDLLYMADPPGFQLLHCLQNSCEGGTSLFSDAIKAAYTLRDQREKAWNALRIVSMPFHYRNDGHHYYHRHPIIKTNAPRRLPREVAFVNWSPPFQAPLRGDPKDEFWAAVKTFGALVEAEENVFEYRLKEGECVVFNNRRVLHARTAFHVGEGERWLKGCYVDTDAFMSRYRVLKEQFATESSAVESSSSSA